jgi:hypothetical protein
MTPGRTCTPISANRYGIASSSVRSSASIRPVTFSRCVRCRLSGCAINLGRGFLVNVRVGGCIRNAADPMRTMSRRIPTIPDTGRCLTPQQELAVDLLATGKTISEAANSIGVSRQTVSEWRNQDPVFEAALNERRQELWSGMSDRLRALLPKAISVLEESIERGDIRVAVAVLRATGLHGLSAPEGPTTPEDAETEARKREATRRNQALFASLA